MASANRMSISFGKTEEDYRVYNYLKSSSNASALIRLLVGLYLEGKQIQGTLNQQENVKEHEEDKQKFNDSFEEVKSWLETLKI